MKFLKAGVGLVLAAVLVGAARGAVEGVAAGSAKEVKPLKVGDSLPDVSVKDAEGKEVKLGERGKGAVIIFYRGGWCPFCNKHLAAVQTIEAEIRAAGYEVLAVSPEKMEHLKETAKQDKVTYTLLSDEGGAAMRAFGVSYVVDEKTKGQLKKYKLDLTEWQGQEKPELPAPALFVVDKEGKVTFVHFDVDYTKRISNEEILKVVGK